MRCEFEHCIYNKKQTCAVTEPEINSFGMCDTCIIISLDTVFLEEEKERQLQELERLWAIFRELCSLKPGFGPGRPNVKPRLR